MRSCSQGRRRSVDRGTCGPGIQPRKRLTPGRRRWRRKRKATSGAPISRGAPESRAVRDPVHVRRHLAREPGEPTVAEGMEGMAMVKGNEFQRNTNRAQYRRIVSRELERVWAMVIEGAHEILCLSPFSLR